MRRLWSSQSRKILRLPRLFWEMESQVKSLSSQFSRVRRWPWRLRIPYWVIDRRHQQDMRPNPEQLPNNSSHQPWERPRWHKWATITLLKEPIVTRQMSREIRALAVDSLLIWSTSRIRKQTSSNRLRGVLTLSTESIGIEQSSTLVRLKQALSYPTLSLRKQTSYPTILSSWKACYPPSRLSLSKSCTSL